MRTTLVVLVGMGTVLALTAPFAGTATAQDQYEPNDDYATATEIEPGDYGGLTLDGEDEGHYAVEMEAGETIDASVTFDEDVVDQPDIAIYDPDGDQVETGEQFTEPTTSTVTKRAAIQASESGTYYVRVDGDSRYQGTANYSLSIAVASNDRFEPNGVMASASQLEDEEYDDLSLLSGEEDYYAVQLREGETLNATIEYDEDAANSFDFDLEDADGDRVEPGDENSDPTSDIVTDRITVEAPDTGTYYLRVEGDSRYQGTSDYSLSVGGASALTTPTPTPTATPTETETATDTATATEAVVTDTSIETTTTDTPIETTTAPDDEGDSGVASGDGPGMGIVAALVALAGGALLATRGRE